MAKKRITIPVFIPHSGCPHACVFCNQWRVTGIESRQKPEEIHQIIEKYLSAVPSTVEKIEIAFFGGSFTAIPVQEQIGYLAAVQRYIDSGVIRSVRVSTRPDYIDDSVLEMLKRFNVETVELGVQSFSDEVLTASGRGHNAGQVDAAVDLLKRYRFRVGIQLMPGLPCDDYRKSIMSAVRTVELMPDDVRIYPAVVLKDTEMERMYIEGGYTPLGLDEAVELAAEMYGMFIERGINVIRMGLHPMDLNGGNVVAGPYHEALGFMIKARYRRNKLEGLIAGSHIDPGGSISLVIPVRFSEEYIGMKRGNIDYLKRKFALKSVEYRIEDADHPYII